MKFQDYKPYLSPALAKTTDLIIESGSGCYVKDVDGNQYIDFVQGIAVNALGHCHPRVVKAMQDQVANLITASFNLVNYPTTLKLAERLAKLAPGSLDCIFFSNSGGEANDGAMKLARAYTKRPAIIAFKGSFHGRTMGATSITGSNSKYRKYVEPLVGSIYFAPYPTKDLCPAGYDAKQRAEYSLHEIESLFKYLVAPETVAAIIVEPVQGEGGYVVPDRSFLQGLRQICDQHGILLIFDEVQCGYGRTGRMFASEAVGVTPDIITLGKAMAGGFPMSAIVSTQKIMSEWHPGMHGTTFGGHPVAAAAALAVLDEYEESHILEHCNQMGDYLNSRLLELAAKYPVIGDVRGIGLMRAVEFVHQDGSPAGDIFSALRQYCQDHGLLVLGCGVYGNGLRFATPLNITKEDLEAGLAIFTEALEAVSPMY